MNFIQFLLFWYFLPQYFVNCCSAPIKQYFLKDYSEVFLMNLNKLLRLRSLAEVSAILQKMRYFGQIKDHLTTFRALIACDIHFCIWELSKFIFVGSPIWFILVSKILEFWRWKLWDKNFVPFHSGNIHIRESKKTGFTFSIELKAKFVWTHGLLLLDFENGDKNILNTWANPVTPKKIWKF